MTVVQFWVLMLCPMFHVRIFLEIRKGKEGPTTTSKKGPMFVTLEENCAICNRLKND